MLRVSLPQTGMYRSDYFGYPRSARQQSLEAIVVGLRKALQLFREDRLYIGALAGAEAYYS
jgi:hypothetical protein